MRIPSLFAVCFGGGALVFCLQLLQTNLTHYDNYTHWAVAVKELLLTNAFPTMDSTMIEYANYPLGSASFIYFVCRVVGNSEHIMIFSQGLLIFAAFSAMFGIIEEKRRLLLTTALGASLSLLVYFNYSIRMSDLLVDFLLPILALAVIAIAYKYRNDSEKALRTSAPILAFLTVMKSTGIIYVGIAMSFLFFMTIRNKTRVEKKNLMRKVIWFCIIVFLPAILWSVRQEIVFVDMANKFELDAGQMSRIFGEKSAADITFIVKAFFLYLIDFRQRATIGFFLFELIGIVSYVIGRYFVKKQWVIGKVLVLLNIVVAFYYLGILGMYLFSMPLVEARSLAGMDRYAASIIVFFGGAISMALTLDIERSFLYRLDEKEPGYAFRSIKTKQRYNTAVIITIIIMAISLTSEYNEVTFNLESYETGLPNRVKSVTGDNWSGVSSEERYLVYLSDENGEVSSGYAKYVVRYYLWTQNADVISSFAEADVVSMVGSYDYLVIVDSDEKISEWMNVYYGLVGEAGIYEVEKLIAE